MSTIKMLIVVSVLCLATTSALFADTHSKLLGKWDGDADTAITAQGLDPSITDDPMVQMMINMMAGIHFDFAESSMNMEMDLMGEVQTLTVKYKVIDSTPESITIENLDGPKAGVQGVITFIDDDHIKIVEDGKEARATYLKRATGGDEAASTEPPVETVEEETTSIVLTEEEPAPTFVVFLPEKIDTVWFWYYYTEEQQSIVQTAVEKALIRSGYEVIDLSVASLFTDKWSIQDITSARGTVQIAKELGATYAVVGKAQANQLSSSVAYGVHVVRSSAVASAKIIRVSDGKVMAIEDVSTEGGGQAQKAAAQGALKDAGKKLGRKLCSAINFMLTP